MSFRRLKYFSLIVVLLGICLSFYVNVDTSIPLPPSFKYVGYYWTQHPGDWERNFLVNDPINTNPELHFRRYTGFVSVMDLQYYYYGYNNVEGMIQKIKTANSYGMKIVFPTTPIFMDPFDRSRLRPDWRDRWRAAIPKVRQMVEAAEGNMFAFYIEDEPYSGLFNYNLNLAKELYPECRCTEERRHNNECDDRERDCAGKAYELIARDLELIIAEHKLAFPNVNTLITNSCIRSDNFGNDFDSYVAAPPKNIDIYSLDCYEERASDNYVNEHFTDYFNYNRMKYNQLKYILNLPGYENIKVLFTYQTFSGPNAIDQTLDKQRQWYNLFADIAGNDPRYIGIYWFLYSTFDGSGVSVGTQSFGSDIKNYHKDVGQRILCSQTDSASDQRSVCGYNTSRNIQPHLVNNANSAKCEDLDFHYLEGHLDGVDTQGNITGWSFDRNLGSQPTQVKILIDGPTEQTAAWHRVVTADKERTDSHNHHGFKIDYSEIPNSLKDDLNHTIYAYEVRIDSKPQCGLWDSPKVQKIPKPPCPDLSLCQPVVLLPHCVRTTRFDAVTGCQLCDGMSCTIPSAPVLSPWTPRFFAGDNIIINFSNGTNEVSDKIKLYELSADDNHPLDWKYLNNLKSFPPTPLLSGTIQFPGVGIGQYNVRYFTTVGTNIVKVATSPTITVTAEVTPTPTPTVSPTPTSTPVSPIESRVLSSRSLTSEFIETLRPLQSNGGCGLGSSGGSRKKDTDEDVAGTIHSNGPWQNGPPFLLLLAPFFMWLSLRFLFPIKISWHA